MSGTPPWGVPTAGQMVAPPVPFGTGRHQYGRYHPSGAIRMKFRPLHDRVVVRRLDAEEKTAGGIIIPDTAKEKPMEGEIVAVGPGARNEKRERGAPACKHDHPGPLPPTHPTQVKIDHQDLL